MMEEKEVEGGQIWVFDSSGLETLVLEVKEEDGELMVLFEYEDAWYETGLDYFINTHTFKSE